MNSAAAPPGRAHRGRPGLAEIVRKHGEVLRASGTLTGTQDKALRAIERCRTPALGGQMLRCDDCGQAQLRYHSCRNRHCPKCQSLAKERWLAARRADLLPVPYFHLVFTLPEALRPLALGNPVTVYGLLFRAAARTLQQFGADPRWLGGQIAATLVLHTWTQKLDYHPHVHALVAGGALAPDGHWVAARRGFLFPVYALSKLFRGKFLAGIEAALERGQFKLAGTTTELADRPARRRWLARLRAQDWVVYAKPALAGSEQVLEYLARYTHKSALSNERILNADDVSVRLSWRDRAHGNRRRILSLPAAQFLSRFTRHVLPEGFTRIRHIGLLASRHKRLRLAATREALNAPTPEPVTPESVEHYCLRVLGVDIHCCPDCGTGRLIFVRSLEPTIVQRPRPP
ncbi:MAG: IS91 family transposase [Burkholderiales bacterium]